MFRSILLTLTLAGVCAAQPPSPRDRILTPIPTFDPHVERRRLIECDERMIPIIEHLIESSEWVIDTFSLSPDQLKEQRDKLAKVRKILAETKERRQKLLDEEAAEAKAKGRVKLKLIPVAPMPHEKR